MCNCRRRRCKCLYNPCNSENKNDIETLCNDIPNSNNNYNSNCSCGFDEEDNLFPENPMFGQSYVPFQTMNETYMPCSGLRKGTIFPELVSEYCPGWSMEEIEYLRNANTIGEGCNR